MGLGFLWGYLGGCIGLRDKLPWSKIRWNLAWNMETGLSLGFSVNTAR